MPEGASLTRWCLITLLAGFGIALLIGCGDPNGRQEIRGTIHFKGQPLDMGNIEFQPAGKEPTQAGSPIRNGRYAIARKQGLVPGSYKVIITSWEGLPPVPDVSQPPPPGRSDYQPKQRIPAKYNEKSSVIVKVNNQGPNTFDFQIE
jgi:hypothetical protein